MVATLTRTWYILLSLLDFSPSRYGVFLSLRSSLNILCLLRRSRRWCILIFVQPVFDISQDKRHIPSTWKYRGGMALSEALLSGRETRLMLYLGAGMGC